MSNRSSHVAGSSRDASHDEADQVLNALRHELQLDAVIPAGGRWGKEYSSIEQKRASGNFEFKSATSPKALADALSALQSDGFYFRGQRSATWKIYSSWQRKFIEHEHTVEDNEMFRSKVCDALEEIRQANLTQETVGVSVTELSDYELLGHLQHYGVATPFIDFAKLPHIALYFAIQAKGAENSNFHSVYAVDGRYREGENEIVDFEDWLKHNDRVDLPKEHLQKRQLHQYKAWNVSALVFHVDENGWNQAIHERRVEKQTGLFLYMKDLDKPAEEYFAEYHKYLCSNKTQCDSRIMRRMICFDFPSSWDNELRTILNANEITEDSLGLSDHTIEKKWREALQPAFPDFF